MADDHAGEFPGRESLNGGHGSVEIFLAPSPCPRGLGKQWHLPLKHHSTMPVQRHRALKSLLLQRARHLSLTLCEQERGLKAYFALGCAWRAVLDQNNSRK
jgi:hypothetical protein